MAKMNFTPADELVDEVWGIGTPGKDAMEVRLKEEIQARFVGEAIKNARLKQHLTQEKLGERVGVRHSQISKIESGKSITYSTIVRVFKAIGAKAATLDLSSLGRVALW